MSPDLQDEFYRRWYQFDPTELQTGFRHGQTPNHRYRLIDPTHLRYVNKVVASRGPDPGAVLYYMLYHQ